MRSFPYTIQLDTMDCGPACVEMIASFYGKDYTLETLRNYSYIAKDGASLLSISKAAEEIGFKTIGGRFTLKQLTEKAPLPCIIHWNQNHFVVVYKVKKRRKEYIIEVADPGKGLIKYSEKEFSEHWISTKANGEEKGVVLLFEPTALFYQQEGEKKIQSNKKVVSDKLCQRFYL